MTVKAVATSRSTWVISDAARRKLDEPAYVQFISQREVNLINFRDTVTEIFRRCLELLAKQHALRVESYAPPLHHALRDEFRANGARHLVLLYQRLS